MLEFIARYWLEFLFGGIATGMSIVCKKFYNLYKNAKNAKKEKEQDAFYTKIEELIKKSNEESQELIKRSTEEFRSEDKKLQAQIDIIQSGILSIQGRNFKQECREFLESDKEITIQEYEALNEEHEVYRGLGGNHDGDVLFELVQKKATNILTDIK